MHLKVTEIVQIFLKKFCKFRIHYLIFVNRTIETQWQMKIEHQTIKSHFFLKFNGDQK
jgi:hypothetical protein